MPKAETVKYLPHHVRLVDSTRPSKKKAAALSTTRWYRKGIKPVGIPSDYTVIETPGKIRYVYDIPATFQLHPSAMPAIMWWASPVRAISSTRKMNDRLKSGETVKIGIEGNFDNEVIMSMNPDV